MSDDNGCLAEIVVRIVATVFVGLGLLFLLGPLWSLFTATTAKDAIIWMGISIIVWMVACALFLTYVIDNQ